MFFAMELHVSRVYVSSHAQGLFKPSQLCIRRRKIALHDENAALCATVAESITNWPEVVAKLRGTRFEKYLTMDGSVLP